MKLKVGSTAMTLGLFFALVHTIWMAMVYFGLAQVYLDWILGLHLLSNPFVLMPFSFATALGLIVFTFLVGYAAGWIFAVIWNNFHKAK
jgi:hypothetical protein